MIKKIIIEPADKENLRKFDSERLKNVKEIVEEYKNNPKEEFILTFDVPSADSKDFGIVGVLKVEGNRFMCYGHRII